jgi:hypothetical protein
MKAVGRHRRGIDKAPSADRLSSAEGVQRAVHVDRPDRLTRGGPGHQERQVHHYVGVTERVTQDLGVADVAAAVLHLRPAVRGGVERVPGDADHPGHPLIGFKQGHQAEPEGTGRAGHRDCQILVPAGRHDPATGGIGPQAGSAKARPDLGVSRFPPSGHRRSLSPPPGPPSRVAEVADSIRRQLSQATPAGWVQLPGAQGRKSRYTGRSTGDSRSLRCLRSTAKEIFTAVCAAAPGHGSRPLERGRHGQAEPAGCPVRRC